MDLVDLIEEKQFIGQEFLAWLWYKAEERGGNVDVPAMGDILVSFEKHMMLEYGEGEVNEKVICRGLQTELKEAKVGLALGKKPEQARIRLARGEYEFNVTLAATTMEFRNVKLPKTVDGADEGDNPESMEGRLLERIGMFEQLTEIVNELFKMFIDIRASSSLWPEELVKIREWAVQGLER